MRRYGRLAALVAVLALVLAGCSSKAKTTAGPSTTPSGKFKLLIPGIFTIGTDMPYAPFESLNAKGVPVGFDIELFEEIAKRMGYRVTWNNAVFDTIFTALGTRWDIVVSAVPGYAPKGA